VRVRRQRACCRPNPNVRISEIAYEIGFQSRHAFNRVFKRITGQSPTSYRKKLPKFQSS